MHEESCGTPTDLSNLAMIPFTRFLQELLVFGHLLAVGERDTVDSLQTLSVRVTEEVRGGVLSCASQESCS